MPRSFFYSAQCPFFPLVADSKSCYNKRNIFVLGKGHDYEYESSSNKKTAEYILEESPET